MVKSSAILHPSILISLALLHQNNQGFCIAGAVARAALLQAQRGGAAVPSELTALQHCCCVSQHCVLAALGSVLLSVLPAGPAQSGILTDREVVSLFLHFTVNPKPRVEFIDRPRCCLRGKECSISRFQQVESRWGYSGTSDRIRSASLLILLLID